MLDICCSSTIKLWRNGKKVPKRTTKIKTFVKTYNWGGIYFPSESDDWKTSEKNNKTIAVNNLYAETQKIYLDYVSKNNSNREKQVILLMISNREICEAKFEGWQQWVYHAVKKLSALIRGIT